MLAVRKIDSGSAPSLCEVPAPQPKEGELLLDVLSVGICGSDLHVVKEDPGYEWMRNYFPRTLGHEIIGRVRSNSSAPSIAPGTVVAVRPRIECKTCLACMSDRAQHCSQRVRIGLEREGGLAEQVVVPASNCFVLPPGIDSATAALLEPLAVAVHGVHKAAIPLGGVVAVIGMGAIGLLAGQVLKAAGAGLVLAMGLESDENSGGFDAARELAMQPVRADHDGWKEYRGRCALVFLAAGGAKAFELAVALAGPRAQIVLAGLGTGPVSFDADNAVRKELQMIGTHGATNEDWLSAIAMASSEQIAGNHIISHTMRLEETPDAFKLLAQGRARKVVIAADDVTRRSIQEAGGEGGA